MQAIVLAAGEGERMRPLTSSRPKVMLPIGGKPLLEHLVASAKEAGVEKFVIVVGYQKEKVMDHFGDGSDLEVSIEYVVQEERQGTGHALEMAEGLAEDRFLVLNGDVLCDADSLKGVIENEGPVVAAVKVQDPDPDKDWILEVEDGYLKSVADKSKPLLSNLVCAGICLLEKKIFEALRMVPASEGGGKQERDLMTGLKSLLADGERIRVAELESWIEIVLPWDILKANETLMPPDYRGILGEVEANVILSGEIAVGKDTVIRSGSYVAGPVVIGDGCDIGPNNFIKGHTSIGDNVRIGNGVVIEDSTIMEGTEISHLCYIGDSLVGSGCSLGVGTIVANRRHDSSTIRSYVNGTKAETERRKLGAIVGEGVKTGVGTIIYPGTVIEAGRWGTPGEVLWGLVPVEKPEPQEEKEGDGNEGDPSEKDEAKEKNAIDESPAAGELEKT
ncbi:MAG TPA: NTP transferase domain-containing protein [Methanotrichaceae archaeon]|nr:NTP transferase domain-containing protein [Methanotrichaceae archaeon]